MKSIHMSNKHNFVGKGVKFERNWRKKVVMFNEAERNCS